jgi:hypothetical protein
MPTAKAGGYTPGFSMRSKNINFQLLNSTKAALTDGYYTSAKQSQPLGKLIHS